ncbi:MAG: (Fe-S)-binding protein [Clostridia bacterium]|nr:(Fe-S)-binding protein [Clostridia bacterium]
MINGKDLKVQDIGKESGKQLTKIDSLKPLPKPYDQPGMEPPLTDPKPEWSEKYCTSLDGYVALDTFEKPKTKEEEDELVRKFLSGLEKMLSAETNKGILQPLMLTLDYCGKCNTCSDACHIFEATNGHELYRPSYRAEILRRIIKKYFTKSGKLLGPLVGADIDLNWETVARLGELAYRCNLCRRCAQTCPLGLDNGMIAREIRKIFSQEMGIAPKPLHENGTVKQLATGSSTGMNKAAFMDIMEFHADDIEEMVGVRYDVPIDKEGADILLIHNAGEFMAWPQNPIAFTIIFEEAGLNWTLSSDFIGYDSVNYGLFYDDGQARKIALRQQEVAKKLGVKKIVIAECGHAHKASAVYADRLTSAEQKIPVESYLPLLRDIVLSGKLDLDPMRNNFPVTLHDPCNIVRQMGIVKPQREILKAICPQFREMTPHGVNNYCCGGGSGFAIMNALNFGEFRNKVSTRKKFEQILNAFQDTIDDPSIPKYVCAPCSNCKGAIRDILEFYEATEKYNIHYDGLVELVVNAMRKFDRPFLEFLRNEE